MLISVLAFSAKHSILLAFIRKVPEKHGKHPIQLWCSIFIASLRNSGKSESMKKYGIWFEKTTKNYKEVSIRCYGISEKIQKPGNTAADTWKATGSVLFITNKSEWETILLYLRRQGRPSP